MFKKIKNKKLLILGITITLVVCLTLGGLTYAFFTAGVIGNDEAELTEVTTGTLKLRLSDTALLNMDNALPGRTETKTFTVTNIGDNVASYGIYLGDVSTSFIGSDLVYSLTSDNDGGTVSERMLPITDEILVDNIVIGEGETQTYTLTIKFLETGLDQNNNQGASYSGKVQLIERVTSLTLAGYLKDEANQAITNQVIELRSEPRRTTTDSNGYYEFKDVELGNHTISLLDGENTVASNKITLGHALNPSISGTKISLKTNISKYVNLSKTNENNITMTLSEEALMLSETSGTIYVGGRNKEVRINGNHGDLTCQSSNQAYAECSIIDDKLVLVPVSTGSGTVTVTESSQNISKTYNFTVSNASLELSETSGSVAVGKSIEIEADGTNIGTLYCGTSDETKATCTVINDKIAITGKGEGTATITVREGNGNNTASYEVTITASGDVGIIALFVDNEPVTQLDDAKSYKLVDYDCANNETVTLEGSRRIVIDPVKTTTSCTLYFEETYVLKTIIINAETPQSDIYVDFTKGSAENNDAGLYYTEKPEMYGEDGQRIYYYRGDVDNNWVSFGGYYWRIVRTTAEGGVKLVYSGGNTTTGPSSLTATSGIIGTPISFNTSYTSKYYRYTYNPNLNQWGGTQTDSTIKKLVDQWYSSDSTLTINDKTFLSETAIYCADESSERISGKTAFYPAYDRLYTNKRPTFACKKDNNNRYTKIMNEITGDNGFLTYPIALLNADELYYSGLITSKTNETTSYILDNVEKLGWWTMTPAAKGDNIVNFAMSELTHYRFETRVIDAQNNARPAVALKSCIIVTGGDGSKEHPYTLSNSAC